MDLKEGRAFQLRYKLLSLSASLFLSEVVPFLL